MEDKSKNKKGDFVWSFLDKFFGIPFGVLALVFLILSIILFFVIVF
ncbi:hypothetical protein [Salinicoccus roseus]|nr:hypothetical protein [Salinicoccus roseus]